ncbi:hypothetical protein KZO25_12680 [Halomonas sp. ANAO-440]|nr:hypothetical protein [Halomonas sp. ANAO-440]
MKTSPPVAIRTYLFLLASLAVLAGCTASPLSETTAELAPLQVGESRLHAVDGTLLLHIKDIPGSIHVDADTEFGASEQFTGASLSPDGEWLAVTTDGVAHSAGWLVRVGNRDPQPAAFQYGGDLALGPWSENGRYAVFEAEGPAPSHTLAVVDRQNLGATVSENSAAVRIPDHEAQVPAHARYTAVGWRSGELVFEVDGGRYRFDPYSLDVIVE